MDKSRYQKAGRIIHNLYEDYFLVETDPIAMVTGTFKYNYPSDIYANKIRKIIFMDGLGSDARVHIIKRLKSLDAAKSIDLIYSDVSDPLLSWIPINTAAEGRKIRIFPNSGRTGYMSIFYIRNAKQLVLDTDVCDIDEFEEYPILYGKLQAFMKDGDPRASDVKQLLDEMEADMTLTLSEMSPDKDTELEADVSHYDESVGEYNDGTF